jgi:hypothetical protein
MTSATRRARGWQGFRRRWALALAVVVAAGCGGDDPAEPDQALAPFVGDWRATSLVLTSVANPQVAPDLVQLGAAFNLNIQPSGQYTAVLAYLQGVQTEIGSISVAGTTVTLQRSFPTMATTSAVYAFAGSELTLDGDTTFDFNFDGTPEPARAHFELVRS